MRKSFNLHRKINKLKLFYSLPNAQGIQIMVNIGTSTFSPTPQATTIPAPPTSLNLSIEIYAYAIEMDQCVYIAGTLTMKESTTPKVSTKSIQE
ncbi:unnamed protein product [Vicia faba]|uniref:Uncharacterized protein n=1 Tax=Vicia faba TaxID=3906 RepID=A0AAV1B0D5_VICFA|nr:unnamed protein product [Vicia faba]